MPYSALSGTLPGYEKGRCCSLDFSSTLVFTRFICCERRPRQRYDNNMQNEEERRVVTIRREPENGLGVGRGKEAKIQGVPATKLIAMATVAEIREDIAYWKAGWAGRQIDACKLFCLCCFFFSVWSLRTNDGKPVSCKE